MNYKETSIELQEEIARRFVLPKDVALVKIDKYNRPYEIVDNKRVICNIRVDKDKNFHNYARKNI